MSAERLRIHPTGEVTLNSLQSQTEYVIRARTTANNVEYTSANARVFVGGTAPQLTVSPPANPMVGVNQVSVLATAQAGATLNSSFSLHGGRGQ